MTMQDKEPGQQKRVVKRNALLLIVVAVAVYAAFIGASVLRSQAGV